MAGARCVVWLGLALPKVNWPPSLQDAEKSEEGKFQGQISEMTEGDEAAAADSETQVSGCCPCLCGSMTG